MNHLADARGPGEPKGSSGSHGGARSNILREGARRPRRGDRLSGCQSRRGIASRRGSSALATLALIAFLVAVGAWLLVRSDSPSTRTAAARAAVGGSMPLRDSPSNELIDARTDVAVRTSVAEVESPDPPVSADVEPSLPETFVYGSLVDASGAPIQGASTAEVTFVSRSGERRAVDARQEGAFGLHALEFGTYWVIASADGYRSFEESFELCPDRPLMRKDFMLQKAVALRVKVTTPDGTNLFDVLGKGGAPMAARLLVPVATREPPGERFDDLVGSLNATFAEGHFQNYGAHVAELDADCMGVLFVTCDLPVYVSLVCHNLVLQTKRVAAGQDEVTFVQSPDDLFADLATIRVRVVDSETELPIDRARVVLRGGTYSNEGVATDAQGLATIDRREPGRFDLQVSANGYESLGKPIDALSGETTDLGTIELDREVIVEGHVLDFEGSSPSATFTLGILDPRDDSIHWFRRDAVKLKGAGTFEIRGLGRRQYVIRANEPGAVDRGGWDGVHWVSGNVLIDARAGSISDLQVCLRPASRLVLQFTGPTSDGLRFRVVDERGFDLVDKALRGAEPMPLELPAGHYDVSLFDLRGAVLSTRSVTLGLEPVHIDLAR
jgi:cbb3-type cytochrome oxidase subunit 3